LKKPAPVATPQPVAAVAANAQSFQQKIQQVAQPRQQGESPAEVHLSSDEVSAALAQAAGAVAQGAPVQASAGQASSAINPASPDSPISPGEPNIKDYQVNFDGDVARGQFLTQIGGKDVYVTVAGHLSSKDGYATFEPTEFKVGDLTIPVSLVNGALQKRLAEQRDQLKLPDSVGDIKVENGQLVVTQK
jgi:hypothetical protein